MARSRGPTSRMLVRLAGVGLAGLSLVLVGCVSNPNASPTSDGEVGTGSASVISAAGEKTLAAGTARFSMKGSTKAKGGSSGLQTAAGSYTMEGSVDFAQGNSEAKVIPDSAGEAGEVHIVSIQDVQYVKLPDTGSDQWIIKEARDPGTGDSISVPLNVVNVLGHIDDVQEVGSDPVAGASATKYTGTTDVQQALEGAGVPMGETESEDIAGDAEISVWLDEQGRIVKTEHKTNAQVGQTELQTEISIRLFDFGVSLDIQAPTASQVNG